MTDARPTVLVVDDDPDLLLLAQQTLEGFDVRIAASGRDALAALRGPLGTIDAVVLDLMMDEMSGFEVLRTIRDDPDLAATTVVVLTARQDAGARDQAEALRADAFLTKPYNPMMLETTLEMLVDRPRQASPEPSAAMDALRELSEGPDGGAPFG